MVPIKIDTQSLADQYDFTSEDIDIFRKVVLQTLLGKLAGEWERAAEENLGSTRKRYIENLVVVEKGRAKGSVYLDYSFDPLIKMLEEGAGAFDMKEGYERSAKKKLKKDGGWYLTIPMRWATPGAIGESDLFSRRMPTLIHKHAKKEGRVDLKRVPESYAEKRTVRSAIGNIQSSTVFEEYRSKSSPYGGISKVTDDKTGQSSYMSFRRVSDNSDDLSWVHSGINAYNLAERAVEGFERAAEEELNDTLNIALGALGF